MVFGRMGRWRSIGAPAPRRFSVEQRIADDTGGNAEMFLDRGAPSGFVLRLPRIAHADGADIPVDRTAAPQLDRACEDRR